MNRLSTHPRAYVRPSAAGTTLGGVARATRESLLLCDAAGFDLLILETVGVGQSETLAAGMVDVFVVLLQAGGGDELQGIKRGILELADHVLVTKADGDNLPAARRAAGEFRSAFQYFPPQDDGWRPEVGICSAMDGSGLSEFDARLADLQAHRQRAGSWEGRRLAQRLAWFEEATGQLVADLVEADPRLRGHRLALRQAVVAQQLTPWQAARQLVEGLRGHLS
jgi:LAO/AO transport system kinase